MTRTFRCLCMLVGSLLVASVQAQPPQPPQPPPPAKYKVTLRYLIQAPRDPHVIAYRAMVKHSEALGFVFDPDPKYKRADTDAEDRSKNYLHGTIGAANALKLLDDPSVQSILLVPTDFELPDGAEDPVTVRLQLGGNLKADRQRELANQVHVLLRELGFREPVGYDHHGYAGRPYTRVVGTIPRNKLDLLQRDLRYHPAGWFGPTIPREEMPSPLRDINPVTAIEVLPDKEAIKQLPEPAPRGGEQFEKISADLWELIKDKDKDLGSERVRVQIAFAGQINPADRDWKVMLQETTPGFFVEGQFGQFVTGMIRLDQVRNLAASPLVSVIRLPRVPRVDVDPALTAKLDDGMAAEQQKAALEQTKLKTLHERGYRGKGVRVALVDRDFRGWKELPGKVRLVDLTTELDPEIKPKKYAGKEDEPGHGTVCAHAVRLAAPDAELVLIRIETLDPYHLQDVVRYIQGGAYAPLVELRDGEIVARAAQLRAKRAELLAERKIILEDFSDEPPAQLARQKHRQRMADHEKLEEQHRARGDRFDAHLKDINSLKGIPVVVNALAWHSGYPLGAASPLSRLLDEPTSPLWFQAVGNTRGQAWLARFRHVPGDAALKFVDDDVPLPKGRWSREINFLGWRPHFGAPVADIPEKTRLRLTLHWREPHDPDYFAFDEQDHYRKPLANLRMQLIRQRDPDTKVLPGDSFELVARTTGWAERIEHMPNSSTYEHVLEATLEKKGRYAIRVEKQVSSQWIFVPHPVRKSPMFQRLEGLTPTGIRPLGVPTLPALEKNWDLRPRIFVEVIDEANRVQGRAVFDDFATEAGAIGSPADARNVISVGAANLKNQPQPYSAFGSPAGTELARRPWLYAYDEIGISNSGAMGTSIANAFAAGTVASMLSGSLTRDQVLELLRAQDGQVLRVPVGK